MVDLEITDDDVKLPADANAAVVARSVATDRYVELTPVYDGGAELEDGATIPVERTVTPVDFDKVLASLDKLATGLVDNPRATNSLQDLVVDHRAQPRRPRRPDQPHDPLAVRRRPGPSPPRATTPSRR